MKHPQSIFPRFLTLVLNSKTELLDLISAGNCYCYYQLVFIEVEIWLQCWKNYINSTSKYKKHNQQQIQIQIQQIQKIHKIKKKRN